MACAPCEEGAWGGRDYDCSSKMSGKGADARVAAMVPWGTQAKKEIAERQRAMAEFNQEIETTPIFQVFAGTQKMRGLWYPVAAFKADNVAKGVVDAYLQEGFVSNMFNGVYKAQVSGAGLMGSTGSLGGGLACLWKRRRMGEGGRGDKLVTLSNVCILDPDRDGCVEGHLRQREEAAGAGREPARAAEEPAPRPGGLGL